MASADMEARILSGEFFQPGERSSSPARSVSTPSPTNTDDELGSDLSAPPSPQPAAASPLMPERSGAQTGVKGVIRDAEHQKAFNREMHRMRINETNNEMEKRSFQAQTIDEEEKGRKLEKEKDERGSGIRQRWLQARKEELLRGSDSVTELNYKRGGLREVGEEGFVDAVERPGWVAILVYEPDIARCQPLIQALLNLSNSHPNLTSRQTPVLLLKARATSLSFSLLPSQPPQTLREEDEDWDDDEAMARERQSRRADPDVLPSLLVYRDGELERSFIRVDWEVGGDGAGLESLFKRHQSLLEALGIKKTMDTMMIR